MPMYGHPYHHSPLPSFPSHQESVQLPQQITQRFSSACCSNQFVVDRRRRQLVTNFEYTMSANYPSTLLRLTELQQSIIPLLLLAT